jgi:hypothetical protein
LVSSITLKSRREKEDEPYPAGVVPIEDGLSDETLCAIGMAYRVLRKALGWDGRPLDENKIRRPWMGLMELVNAAHINRVVTAEIDEMLADVLALADPATLDISIPVSRRGAWWKGYYSI